MTARVNPCGAKARLACGVAVILLLAAAAMLLAQTGSQLDDFGFKAIEKPVHVHDLHATILYLMGIDHTKLTYQYSGRDFRLTDVSGTVLHEIIA